MKRCFRYIIYLLIVLIIINVFSVSSTAAGQCEKIVDTKNITVFAGDSFSGTCSYSYSGYKEIRGIDLYNSNSSVVEITSKTNEASKINFTAKAITAGTAKIKVLYSYAVGYGGMNQRDTYTEYVITVLPESERSTTVMESGVCGNSVTYCLYGDNRLVLSGSGTVTPNFFMNRTFGDVYIIGNIIGLGSWAFGNCKMNNLYIGKKLLYIETCVFYGTSIANVYYEGNKTEFSKIVIIQGSNSFVNAKTFYECNMYCKHQFVTETYSPTCVDKGFKKQYCSLCGCYRTYDIKNKIEHSYTHYQRVEPTVNNTGNIEYWYCNSCHCYFSDIFNETVIKYKDTIIPKIIMGDANGDQKIDIVDLTNLAEFLLSNKLNFSPALDMNNDGKITLIDLFRLKKHIAES